MTGNKRCRRLHLLGWCILASLSYSGASVGSRLLEPEEEETTAFCGGGMRGSAPIRRGVPLAINPKSSLSTDVESIHLDACDLMLSVTLKADRACRSPVLLLRVSGATLAFNSSWSYAYPESADPAQPPRQRQLVASASFRVYDEGRYYFEVYVEYCERVDPANFSKTCAVVDYENLIAPAANQRLNGGISSGDDASTSASTSTSGIPLLPWTNKHRDAGSPTSLATGAAESAAAGIVSKPGRWVNRHVGATTAGLSMRFQTAHCFSAVGVNGGSKPKRVIHSARLSPGENNLCKHAEDLSRFKGYAWEEETGAFPDWKSIL